MTEFLRLAVLLTAIVNPARLAGAVSFPDRDRRVSTLAGGAAFAFGASAVLAGVAGPVLDWLAISPETFRIAAGAIVVVAGLAMLVMGVSFWGELPPGLRTALAPVAFPVLLAPELVAAVTSYGADHGAGTTIGAVAVALAVCVAGGLALGGERRAVRVGTERLASVVAVAAGLALAVSGILDI